MAAATTALRALASNPQVRNAVRQGARNVGLRALGKVNQRRARRGRRVLIPASNFGGPAVRGPQRGYTRKQEAIPVRTAVVTNNRPRDMFVSDTEVCSWPVPAQADKSGTPGGWQVDPVEYNVWPKLGDKARMFQMYDLVSLTIEFTPIAGTQNNGTIVFGWSPTSDFKAFNTFEEMCGLPKWETASISSPFRFTVPASLMNKNGMGLFIPNSDVTVGEPTNYYAGCFVYLCIDCSQTPGTDVGTIKSTYQFRLKNARLDTSVSSAMVDCNDADHGWELLEKGHFSTHIEDENGSSLVYFSSLRRVMAMLAYPHSTPSVLSLDGNPLTPTATFDDDTEALALYDVGRNRGEHYLVSSGAPHHLMLFELDITKLP